MDKIEWYQLLIIIYVLTTTLSVMPVDIDYRISPLHIWCIFLVYNLLDANIGVFSLYGILNAIFSLDYRILLIGLNMIGLYLFLRHARIDFTMRIAMNHE